MKTICVVGIMLALATYAGSGYCSQENDEQYLSAKQRDRLAHAQVNTIDTSKQMSQATASVAAVKKPNVAMMTQAEQISRHVKSDAFHAKQQALQDAVASVTGQSAQDQADDGPKLVKDQLVLFVSSSMPIVTLRRYARDLARVGGVMVMRGAIGGATNIGPTMRFSAAVLTVKEGCQGEKCRVWSTEILFDPILFRLYDIQKVPALIYQPDMNIESYCHGLEKATKASAVVYGDASLKGLVEHLNTITPMENLAILNKML